MLTHAGNWRGFVWTLVVMLGLPALRAAATDLSPEEAQKIGVEAYIYAYPLVTMEMTRRVMTNVAAPEAKHAPMGQFANMRSYPDADFKDITAPNADTLYSVAWLDVEKEPYVFSFPDAGDRYFLFPILSGWTDVFQVPGKRTTGDNAQKFLISSQTWKGDVPAGVTHYKSPTSIVWILGRTYCNGTPEDYKLVHAFQDKLSLVPLSSYGKPYTPAPGKVDPKIDTKTGVRDQVGSLSPEDYFTLFATLLKTNPPAAEDAPIVAKLAKLGIKPGESFDASKLSPAVVKALKDVPKLALGQVLLQEKNGGRKENGWTFMTETGIYKTNYVQRALVTLVGLGANRPQDAVYPLTSVDATGKQLDGKNKYTLRFAKGEFPPAKAFWSLTMYNAQYFFVKNPLNRYTVSSRSSFKANEDGSVDVYIQNVSPGKDKEANWLPAPEGNFVLMMRLYWPSETAPSLLDGSWKLPPVNVAK